MITREARLSVRRVYGDFTSPNLAKWREALANHGIQPVQQYRNSVGKNASDSALIIDAMDLLHGRCFDGFCLVSSDGDFTRLATRIREDGLSVLGFGRKHAPKAFVSACERYVYIENLGVNSDKTSEPVQMAPVLPDSGSELKPRQVLDATADRNKLKNLLSRAYTNVADDDGWALISRIVVYLRANHSDFDPRSYGASNFVRLLQASGSFDVEQRKQGNGTAHFCRPAKRPMPASYVTALKDAVAGSQGDDGWSILTAIGNYLRAHGKTLDESGCTSLTDALRASGLFAMRDLGGMNKDFRLGNSTC